MKLQEQFIITAGTNIHLPVGPFPSEDAAHKEYCRNQPQGQVYLSPPTIVRLLHPTVLPEDGEVPPPHPAQSATGNGAGKAVAEGTVGSTARTGERGGSPVVSWDE
jgi:hypothetical protein